MRVDSHVVLKRTAVIGIWVFTSYFYEIVSLNRNLGKLVFLSQTVNSETQFCLKKCEKLHHVQKKCHD